MAKKDEPRTRDNSPRDEDEIPTIAATFVGQPQQDPPESGTLLTGDTGLSNAVPAENLRSDGTMLLPESVDSQTESSRKAIGSQPVEVRTHLMSRAVEESSGNGTQADFELQARFDPEGERALVDSNAGTRVGDSSADVIILEGRTMLTHDSKADTSPPGSTESGGMPKPKLSGSWVDEQELSSADQETRIGRFFIQKKLGEGAFGMVYLAQDRQLDRQVAIKVAKVGVFNGRADVDRFLREARSAAHLRHPNIVPVFEVGTYRNSNYIAYEFIKGSTLSGLLKNRKRLAPLEAAAMARKLAMALHYAHQHGIVHRDMKPDNVLLDHDGEPHIADFGLARMDGDVSKTRDGLLMGTPLYMSPEQASGRGNAADGRSDVWSMGVIIEEMLTGLRPFRGNLTQILQAIQNDEPEPLRRIDTSLPRDLETIVQKCLAKKAEERYQTALELAEELDRFLRGEPILARPISWWERGMRWAKRNPVVAALVGTVAATLLLGTIVSTFFAVQANRNAAIARVAERNRTLDLLVTLQTAEPGSLNVILDALKPVREDVREGLQSYSLDTLGSVERSRLRLASVSLFPESPQTPEILKKLAEDLLAADGQELVATSQVIADQAETFVPHLWQLLNDGQLTQPQRFRALSVLATAAPRSVDWTRNGETMVQGLMSLNVLELPDWFPALQNVRDQIQPRLEQRFVQSETADERRHVAIVVSELFDDKPDWLVAMASKASPEQLPPLVAALRKHPEQVVSLVREELSRLLVKRDSTIVPDESARRAGLLGILLAEVSGDPAGWDVLRLTADRSARTEMIQQASSAGLTPQVVMRAIRSATEGAASDPGILAGQLIVLGQFPRSQLLPQEIEDMRLLLEDQFRGHPDSGVHGACEWVLRRWGFQEVVQGNIEELKSASRTFERTWHVDQTGTTFLVVEGPVTFRMGITEFDPYAMTDPTTQQYERPHQRLIPRSYGIGQTEVTVREFLQFRREHMYSPEYTVEPDGPVIQVTWYDAARYCRWLSEQAGIPKDQMCFPPVDQIGPEMTLPPDVLQRTGYRLPTAAEWENAARAGTHTRRPFGTSNEYVTRYCRFNLNSDQHAWPEFDLPPNDWGLFAMQGNVLEWCQDWYFDDYPPEQDVMQAEATSRLVIDGTDERRGFSKELRGGDGTSIINMIRVSDRDEELPDLDSYVIGFRLARTYAPPRKP